MIFCFFSCYCCCWAVPLHCSKFWVLVRWPGSHGETRAGGKRSILHQLLLLLRSYTSYPSCSLVALDALATLPCIVATCLAVTLPFLWTLPNTRFAPVVLCHLITVASQDLRQEQLKYKFCLAVLKLSATSKVELIQATSTNAMLM